jgi:cardiolipin synthase
LNFEVDLEVMDAQFASEVEGLIEMAMASAKPVLLQSLRARSFWVRLLDRIIWLGSPYL